MNENVQIHLQQALEAVEKEIKPLLVQRNAILAVLFPDGSDNGQVVTVAEDAVRITPAPAKPKRKKGTWGGRRTPSPSRPRPGNPRTTREQLENLILQAFASQGRHEMSTVEIHKWCIENGWVTRSKQAMHQRAMISTACKRIANDGVLRDLGRGSAPRTGKVWQIQKAPMRKARKALQSRGSTVLRGGLDSKEH